MGGNPQPCWTRKHSDLRRSQTTPVTECPALRPRWCFGYLLKSLMDYLVNTLTFNAHVLENPAIRKSFDDLLMSSMLALPHNKMDQLYEDQYNIVAPAVVRRAEEYMQAHLNDLS